jgi:hypothetical protein
MNAAATDVMREGLTRFVVLDLADECRADTQRGEADDGIGGRAALDNRRGTHVVIKLVGCLFVHEHHAALGKSMTLEEIFLCASDHIHDRIAEAEHLVCFACHFMLRVEIRGPFGAP